MKKVIFAYLGVLILLLLMAYFIDGPLIPTDEQFYINYARCFVGLKEKCLYTGVPYGYSFFLIPFVLISDLFFQFKIILFFNSFVLSFVFLIGFFYFRKFQNKPENVSIILALITSFFPAFFLSGKTVMTESLFILLFGIVFLLYLSVLKNVKKKNIFLLGFLSFLLFLIRSNGIIIFVLIFGALIFELWKSKRRALIYFFLGFTPLLILHFYLVNFFFDAYEPMFLNVGNSFLLGFFSFSWIKNLFSSYLYIALTSFFIIPVFVFSLFNKEIFLRNINVFVFVLAFILNIVLVAVLFEAGDRFDHHMYGRYLEAFLLPIFLLSLNYVFFERELFSVKKLSVIFVFLFVSILIMYKPSDFLTNNVYSILPFSGFFIYFENFGFYLMIICFSYLSFLFFKFKYFSKLLIVSLFVVLSFFNYFLYFFNPINGLVLVEYLNKNELYSKNVFFDMNVYHPYLTNAYSYFFPNMTRIKNLDFCTLNNGFLISSKNLQCENTFLLTFENHQNIALYTFEKEIYEELRQKNLVIVKEDILNKDLRSEISVLKDLNFLNARFLEFSVKNITDEVWISYYASRHSRFQENPIAVREYCLNSEGEVVGEKRRHFDSIVFPGQSQNFTFLTFKPVCSKMIFDVVQEGYSGFEPKFEILLK